MIYGYEVKENGCWIWVGKISGRGYGSFPVGNINYAAHRIYYEQARGEIPDGMVLDHLCRNIKCVNPDHLEPVPMKENTLRGIGPTALNAIKTHCPKGHPYNEDNLRIRRGRRYCNACDTEHKLAHYKRKRAALAPEQDK